MMIFNVKQNYKYIVFNGAILYVDSDTQSKHVSFMIFRYRWHFGNGRWYSA